MAESILMPPIQPRESSTKAGHDELLIAIAEILKSLRWLGSGNILASWRAFGSYGLLPRWCRMSTMRKYLNAPIQNHVWYVSANTLD